MAERKILDITTTLEKAAIREQLQRISQSPSFQSSPKLAGFLEYTVEQVMAGRGASIRAKTIGIDLYEYTAEEIERKATVVRVDAGRVRKKLQEYYAEYAAEGEIVIDLPKGSYAPVFLEEHISDTKDENGVAVATSASVPPDVLMRARRTLVAGLAFFIAAAGLVGWGLIQSPQSTSAVSEDRPQLTSIFEDSPARVRAINLAQQGRDLIFPAVDRDRLSSALQVFSYTKEEDPDYFGAYAGAAQVHTMYAILAADAETRSEQLKLAGENAERAKYLAPGSAWSLSAQAWIDFASGRCDTALRLSERAARSDPTDPHLAEFDALISLFCDRFSRVQSRVETILPVVDGNKGYVFTNALGSVYFHQGDYRGTIQQFESAIAQGGPTGPISLAYLMAAHYRLGEFERARELVQLYHESFGTRRVDLLMSSLYSNPEYGADLVEAMAGAGFRTD